LAKDDQTHFLEVFGNAFVEADFFKFFTFRTSFGGNHTSNYSSNYAFIGYYPIDNHPDNTLKESSGYTRSWTWTNSVSFTKTFGREHKLKALAGTEAINNYARENIGISTGFFSEDVNYRYLSNGAGAKSNFSYASASTLYSLIGEADYDFKERYYLKT